MRLGRLYGLLFVSLLCIAPELSAQRADVDVSAVHDVYRILDTMRSGAAEEEVSRALDTVFATRAYQTMFHHYNRSWRPHELPPAVFKRMILSLRFPAAYAAGENRRADQMLPVWRRFYTNLPLYRANIGQLDSMDVQALVDGAAHEARQWLPADWPVPSFYLPVIPSGGSPAFSIDTAEGYDFFQLPRDSSGAILWGDVRSTIAHETHHLAVRAVEPTVSSVRDSVALEFLAAFMAEGTAVKLVNDYPGGCVPRIDATRWDPVYNPEVAQWWTRYTADEPALFHHVAATFDSAYAGTLTRDQLQAELGSYWLAGFISPIYFVGAELYGAIYQADGKDSVFAAMRDARHVLPMYDAAIRKRPQMLGGCVVFPDSTMRHARAIEAGH
jgi:Putative zinc dependent peptidase (DUF5700)